MCRSAKKTFHGQGQGRVKHAKWLDTTDSPNQREEPLFVIKEKSSYPYCEKFLVNGQPLTMEVDTGAAVSLAPESACHSYSPLQYFGKLT